MRTAFSLWNERIAPVFDVGRQIWIVDAEQGCITAQVGKRFTSRDPQVRAVKLAELHVGQLVCGAISREASDALTHRGIQVVSFISGELNQIIHAWLSGTLNDERLMMPGCGKGKHRGPRKRPRKQRNSQSDNT